MLFAIRQNPGQPHLFPVSVRLLHSGKLVIPGEHANEDPRLTQRFKCIRRLLSRDPR